MAKLKCFVGRQRRDGTADIEFVGRRYNRRTTLTVRVPSDKIEIISRGVVRRGLLECQRRRKWVQYDPDEYRIGCCYHGDPIVWEIEVPTAYGPGIFQVKEEELVGD